MRRRIKNYQYVTILKVYSQWFECFKIFTEMYVGMLHPFQFNIEEKQISQSKDDIGKKQKIK